MVAQVKGSQRASREFHTNNKGTNVRENIITHGSIDSGLIEQMEEVEAAQSSKEIRKSEKIQQR